MDIKREMEWQDLSCQQLIKMDTIYFGNDVVSKIEKTNNVVTSSFKKCIANSSQRQHRKAGIQISFGDIQQHFGMKLDDAAKSLCGKLTFLGKLLLARFFGKIHILFVVANIK